MASVMDDNPLLLTGVPETALITLYNRASEASRADGILSDPLAVTVVQSLSYPFRQRFGNPDPAHALRARQFDGEVRDFLRAHPGATIASLGEGLETQLWRAGAGCGRWVSVDVPEMIQARRRLLPADPRNILIAGSAWDLSWTEALVSRQPVLILAQGLLMYFPQSEVEELLHGLIISCPGARLVFDTIPSWAATTVRGHRAHNGYRMPPQPWGTGRGALDRLLHRAGIQQSRLIPVPAGRGFFWGRVYPALTRALPGTVPMVVAVELPTSSERPASS